MPSKVVTRLSLWTTGDPKRERSRQLQQEQEKQLQFSSSRRNKGREGAISPNSLPLPSRLRRCESERTRSQVLTHLLMFNFTISTQ